MQFNRQNSNSSELDAWRQFLARSTLWLGVLLSASAVICGVAANWQEMSKVQRLLGAQGLLVVCTLLAIWMQIRLRPVDGTRYGIPGALLALAGMLLGALLALLGQIYQTGADTWELFAAWALLLLPWTLLAGSQIVWLLWVMVSNVAAALWLYDGIPAWWSMRMLNLPALALNLMLLIAWEWAIYRGRANATFGPRILVALIIGSLTLTSFAGASVWTLKDWFWLAATLSLTFYYTKIRRDLLILTIVAVGVVCASIFFAVDILGRLGGFEAWMLMLLVLLVLGEVAWMARSLRRLAAESYVAVSTDSVPTPTISPWYVHVLLGLGAWLTTLLLLAFLVFIHLVTTAQGALIAGLILCVAGTVLLRIHASPFLHQCGTALAFSGQLLLAYGLLSRTPETLHWMTVLLIAVAMYVLGINLILRFLSGLLIAFAISGLLAEWVVGRDLLDLWLIYEPMQSGLDLLPNLVTGVWGTAILFLLSEYRSERWARALEPLAWAGLLMAQSLAWKAGGVSMQQWLQLWQLDPRSAMLMLSIVLLPSVVALILLWSRRATLTDSLLWGVPLALLALACFWLPSPGVAYALTWMILGFGLNRRLLLLFGGFSLLAYLGIYYYQLQVPLFDKAIWLGGAALLLFFLSALFGLLPRLERPQDQVTSHPVSPPVSVAMRWRTGLIFGGLVLILVMVNGNIWQREKLLTNGKVLLLELAPVDPRSLMQGDYMVLNFAVGRAARQWAYGALPPEEVPAEAYMILTQDARGVGHVLRFQQDWQPRAENETALLFRLRDDGVRIVTNAYFFPEGQAAHYQAARYGELRVAENGEALLVRMLDQDLRPL